MNLSFSAFEYCSDEKFHPVDYRYQGSSEKGWQIYRNGNLSLSLGPGYLLLKSLYCGVCSTDMARAKLPFPLPQITGHEVIALYDNQPVAVEINASHLARDLTDYHCYYCEQGLGSHCPERLTLGIDRLPGGFSPYILAPINAICPLPNTFDLAQSAVIEPFAAALHAVEQSKITSGMEIAIVGPKRLGLLLILALTFYRQSSNLDFSITTVIRHETLSETCQLFGADEVILSKNLGQRQFDIVYDTSGSQSGFESSVNIAKSMVHLKSTHGLAVGGFRHLTRMVIDELSLYPMESDADRYLDSSLQDEKKCHVLIDIGIPDTIRKKIEIDFPEKQISVCDIDNSTTKEVELLMPVNGFKKFDIVLVSSIEQFNRVMDYPNIGCLVRAQGRVHWFKQNDKLKPPWDIFFEKKLILNTSRCGDFSRAIKLIAENSDMFSQVMPKYISDCYDLTQLNEVFSRAREDVASIKLLIKHED